VLVHNGRIVAVGAATENPIPSEATRLDVDGLFVLAGFQNSHVHFTETKWENAAKQPAAQLSAQLEDMLLRWGATTVVDTGSLLSNTLALRARIESGEVRGPRIYTVGTPIYPHDGIPFYLRESLPAEVLPLLPTPQSGTEAAAIVMRQLEAGADALKLFTGSWVERGRVLPMDAAVARTAADTAHERGKLVFAHASNIAGLEPALEARVNVLAHALDDDRGWNETHVARMKAIGMAMIPTLKLFGGQNFTRHIQAEVGTYAKAGGQILFGTDAGYLTDYDTTDEFTLMAGAGLDWRAILASLTTAPAERFGETLRRGRVAAGLDADLVVLGGDPSADVTAFASVRYTIRGGRVVYAAPTKPEDRSRFAR
jgi:imidazolonepropionase-like amidohydrolase